MVWSKKHDRRQRAGGVLAGRHVKRRKSCVPYVEVRPSCSDAKTTMSIVQSRNEVLEFGGRESLCLICLIRSCSDMSRNCPVHKASPTTPAPRICCPFQSTHSVKMNVHIQLSQICAVSDIIVHCAARLLTYEVVQLLGPGLKTMR